MQEFDIPVLSMNIPNLIQIEKVNTNDELFMTMVYDPTYNPDTLLYSCLFMYKLEKVAIAIFDYKELRFKIWNYFSDF